MEQEEHSRGDRAAEIYGVIVRRLGRELRSTQRHYARIFAARGLDPAHVGDLLGLEPRQVMVIVLDESDCCTECAFGRHGDCLVLSADIRGDMVQCRCPHDPEFQLAA